MRNTLMAAALVATGALPAYAEITRVESQKDVAATADALAAAIEGAGAKVIARVDHAGAAQSAGMELAPSQVLIFGNPKIGTPAMQADPLAGLYLPLKALVYQDAEGKVWIAYEPPGEMLGGLNIPADAPILGVMAGALDKLSAAASK